MPFRPGCARLRYVAVFGVLTASFCAHRASVRAADVVVTPAVVRFDRPESNQQLLVSSKAADGRTIDATREARYRSVDPSIARVDDLGLVEPLRDGRTTIQVEHAGASFSIPVEIAGVDRPQPISFPRDVTPILSKTGCNTGGCHGKAEGQNGFKLSVFGFDPTGDFAAITQEARGRRVFLPAAERSLLLLKATAELPHGGGQRLTTSDLRYRRLRRWIAEGGQYVTTDAPQIVRIEVEPQEQVLLARENRQLRVWAIDEAGVRRCVTTEAEYESNAAVIAGVDGRGFVQAGAVPGEAAILARYLGQLAICRVTIPRPGVKVVRPPEVNFIDRLAWDKLQRLGIPPSELCDDATFIRRATLDVCGMLPTSDEARAFLADKSPDKRARWIDALLTRPEYVDYWTMRFSDLLRVDRQKIQPEGAVAVTRWLRRQFAENRPYDALVRELVTAKGPATAEGAAAYFKAVDTPELMARYVSQAFLGVRIECAQCHHHPSDRWGQDDYFAMAALFSGVVKKKLPGGGETIAVALAKEVKHPRTGEVIAPKPLGGELVSFLPHEDRRVHLARWMTADDNPYFAPLIANRLFANYFGRGLVEQIDDLRTTNPATNEPLLRALADHMRAVRYDLKEFTRTLLNSRLYQLSSATVPDNIDDRQNFSHALQKTVPAEVLLDAVGQATGVPEHFEGWPAGYRAVQIWDNKLPLYFFRIFGRPVRASVCECERSGEPSVAQALHLMNSPEIAAKIQAHDGVAAKLAASDNSSEQVIDELFLRVLTRYPRLDEKALLSSTFAADDRRRAIEDLLWALINSKEFIYSH
ncbi:MAG: DUF1549 and DUF1553 domain-containing protein [Pirellulales bacterium]